MSCPPGLEEAGRRRVQVTGKRAALPSYTRNGKGDSKNLTKKLEPTKYPMIFSSEYPLFYPEN